MSKKPISRKDNLVVQELNNEVLIYDLKINKAFCLNETSALVWQLCDGEKTVTEISRQLSNKLNSKANEDFVWLALEQLKEENLLANSEEITPDYSGMSRREVIRKVGLGTMIALPIVTGLIAPTAAHAQSRRACTAPGNVGAQDFSAGLCCPCVNTSDCAGGFGGANPQTSCQPVGPGGTTVCYEISGNPPTCI